MSQSVQWAAIAGTVVVVVLALIKLYKAFNSPAGERYLRQRTQGPFVPVADETASATPARSAQSSSAIGGGEP